MVELKVVINSNIHKRAEFNCPNCHVRLDVENIEQYAIDVVKESSKELIRCIGIKIDRESVFGDKIVTCPACKNIFEVAISPSYHKIRSLVGAANDLL